MNKFKFDWNSLNFKVWHKPSQIFQIGFSFTGYKTHTKMLVEKINKHGWVNGRRKKIIRKREIREREDGEDPYSEKLVEEMVYKWQYIFLQWYLIKNFV